MVKIRRNMNRVLSYIHAAKAIVRAKHNPLAASPSKRYLSKHRDTNIMANHIKRTSKSGSYVFHNVAMNTYCSSNFIFQWFQQEKAIATLPISGS